MAAPRRGGGCPGGVPVQRAARDALSDPAMRPALGALGMAGRAPSGDSCCARQLVQGTGAGVPSSPATSSASVAPW
eukprot:15431278-Alexandrium_andersonii.AAC.1